MMKKVIFALATILVIGTTTTVLADTLNSDKEGKQLREKFQQLTRNNVWEEKEKVDLQFSTYHPQGMTKVGDLYYMSSVEIIEKSC